MFLPQRTATPRRKDEQQTGSRKSVQNISNNNEEENSSQAVKAGGSRVLVISSSENIVESGQESTAELSQEVDLKRKSKLRKGRKIKDESMKMLMPEDINAAENGKDGPGDGGELQPGHASDGSSAGTEPFNGEDHGIHQESPRKFELLKEVEDLDHLLKSEEDVEEVVDPELTLESGEGGAVVNPSHGTPVDEGKRLRLYELLKENIEEQEGNGVANMFSRLGLASKQRSANPFSLAASLPCLEPGQVPEASSSRETSRAVALPVEALHRVTSQLKSLGLAQCSSIQPSSWVPLVKQRGRTHSIIPVPAPVSTRLPRRAKTEAMIKSKEVAAISGRQRAADIFDYDDDDDFEGPPPLKTPRGFTFLSKDKEERAALEKAKKDSLFDNLRESQGTSASGNSVHDVVGNILHLPGGITASLVRSRKKSEEEEVQIVNQVNPKKEAEAGTSTSSNFRGSCPLCSKEFGNHLELETHASSCEGESASQVI